MEPLHPIQREIMRLMTLHASPRYSDIKPEDVDGNLFMYHLNELMKDGYIIKTDKQYGLTIKGRRHAGIISVDTGLPRLQPKIVVMIYAKNTAGEYLLFRWKRQPFMNTVSLPYGKTWFGEPIQKMAERELAMKTGLNGMLAHIGDAYVKTSVGSEIISHMLVHIFSLSDWSGTAASEVPTGDCFWAKIENIPPEDQAPGFLEIVAAIETSKEPGFFKEIETVWH